MHNICDDANSPSAYDQNQELEDKAAQGEKLAYAEPMLSLQIFDTCESKC